MTERPNSIEALVASGYVVESVKAEIKRNAIKRIQKGLPLIDGMVGYDSSVLPQIENAILADHDIILLGERGQGKTKLIRSLTELLDEEVPVLVGGELNDDPLAPISKSGRQILESQGLSAKVGYLKRSDRYGEKLATPDTSMADLVGEVDPIKVAEGRYLNDELVIHYGLVPRSNRGIFAINELPDLPERIQVGLLNLLEERDVQIRGFKVRLPLDIFFVASANPEDYTNRGRLITPLKDRFGAQIRTHYPKDLETEIAVVHQDAHISPPAGIEVIFPEFMEPVITSFAQLARKSPSINQRSGVSVRLSISAYETLAAASIARALRSAETLAVPRISDLPAILPAVSGKLEVDGLEDTEESQVFQRLLAQSVLASFKSISRDSDFTRVPASFDESTFEVGSDLPSGQYLDELSSHPDLANAAHKLAGESEVPLVASAIEFILEGLHLSKRLNKSAGEGKKTYFAK